MRDKILIVLSTLQTLALIAIFVVLVQNRQEPKKQVAARMEPQTRIQEPIKLNEKDPVWGSNDAPNTLVMYIDYECPFCKAMYKNIKSLEDEYITTGKLKVILRDLPLRMHQNARTVAAAAECARQQGKYWDFVDKALTNDTRFEESMLDDWGKELGIQFGGCVEDVHTMDVVLEDLHNAQQRHLSGTPAVFINNTYYRGTIPASDIKRILEGKKPVERKSGTCGQ